MSNAAYAATAADSIIVAAQGNASMIEIHYHSGDAGFLGFGEPGVVDQGIKISASAPYYKIGPGDPRLLQAIHMICDGAGSQAGGYQIS